MSDWYSDDEPKKSSVLPTLIILFIFAGIVAGGIWFYIYNNNQKKNSVNFDITEAYCKTLTNWAANRERDNCFLELARKTADASFCDKTDQLGLRDVCLEVVMVKTQNPDLCGKKTIGSDTCYWNFAKSTWNVALCEKIINSRDREKCKDGFR